MPESFVTRLRTSGRPASELSDVSGGSDEEGHADAKEIRDAMKEAGTYESGSEEEDRVGSTNSNPHQ